MGPWNRLEIGYERDGAKVMGMSSEVKPAPPPSDRSRARKKKPATREELLRNTEHDPKGAEELVRFVDQLRHGEDTYGSRL